MNTDQEKADACGDKGGIIDGEWGTLLHYEVTRDIRV